MKTTAFGPRAFRCLTTCLALVLSLTFLAIAGCGGSKVNGTDPVTAPTVAISADNTSIQPGGSATLTVVATKSLTVTISGSDGSSFNLSATGGTQSVSPKTTTVYTATATGTGGQVTATVTITVAAPTGAPTVTMSANPTSITAGTNATLTIAATNATKVVVTGSDNTSFNIAPAGGTQIVTPTATTTYTATATGAGGTATATATVTVTAAPPPAAPTVTITATPATINSGSSSTLTIAATNATQVVLTGTDGSDVTLPGAGGTQTVSPTKTATYQATASGPGGSVSATAVVTVNAPAQATITLAANPTSITAGSTSTLTAVATGATAVTIAGTDGSSYTLQPSGGTQSVSPKSTTTYTATATAAAGNATAQATVTVNAPGSIQSIDHVIFMLQENHTFDNYFGMLNPYRKSNGFNIGDDGKEYDIDGVDDKLQSISNQTDEGTSYPLFKFATTCIDDMSSSWLESYGDVNRYDFLTSRPIKMDGFVHDAEGFAKNCAASGTCSGTFSDTTGLRAMGYYDQGFLNYYYYMASQFAVSNRWFSPLSSKSIPNRIATFTGGTTQGLVYDPGSDDKLPQLDIDNIFHRLDQANVTWKLYYTVKNGLCASDQACGGGPAEYPATTFSSLSYSYQYVYGNPNHQQCTGTTQPSSVVGDSTNSFCIDPNHVAPIGQYFTDLKNGTLPSFAFIEAGYGNNDEHPGSGQSILAGQAQVANVINSLMGSSSWKDSVFFLAYDEGGGPYDHVPPVPGHSNDFSPAFAGIAPDISGISVNPDSYGPCVPATTPATTHCDLRSNAPGANSGDAAAQQGFAAQIGFRVPNMVVSPFTRKHYVSNIPMDHTAVIRFVEKRFLGASAPSLTARDAAQPDLLDFFDFTATPWATPPTPPAPVTPSTLGYDPCTPDKMQ